MSSHALCGASSPLSHWLPAVPGCLRPSGSACASSGLHGVSIRGRGGGGACLFFPNSSTLLSQLLPWHSILSLRALLSLPDIADVDCRLKGWPHSLRGWKAPAPILPCPLGPQPRLGVGSLCLWGGLSSWSHTKGGEGSYLARDLTLPRLRCPLSGGGGVW